MTIVSKGYSGPVTSEDWASLVRGLPKRYWVEDSSAARVVIVAGVDRTVRVNLGKLGGWGVFDEVTATEDVQINQDLPTSGNVLWYLISLRRDWALGTSTVQVVTGTTLQALPVRQQEPGVGQDDHPLALVQITGGSQEPTAVVDLRVWGGEQGLMQAGNNDMFKQYIDWPGALVRYQNEIWGYFQSTAGSATSIWEVARNVPQVLTGANAFGSIASGWFNASGSGSRLVRDGHYRTLQFELTRSGPNLESGAKENIIGGDVLLASLANVDDPPVRVSIDFLIEGTNDTGGSSHSFSGQGHITRAGNLYLNSMSNNKIINNNIPSKVAGTVTWWVD